ncbi:MAG: hypothetical protein KKH33_12845 [Alphaproteobacteria bacterium]|nr:hypothetical protein [Alphaproteobacteria bacterium]
MTNKPKMIDPMTHTVRMIKAPKPVPIAAPACSAPFKFSMPFVALLIPAKNQNAIKILKPMNDHLKSLPIKLRFGFLNSTPQLGHLKALSLTLF